MRARGRVLLAVCTVLALLAATPAAALAEWPSWWPTEYHILAGANRYETAAAIADEAYPNSEWFPYLVVTTGENWPDALGATAYAGAVDGPIVPVVGSASWFHDAFDSVFDNRIDPGTPMTIVGGESAIGSAFRESFKYQHYLYTIAGVDRYETARKLAQKTIDILGADYDGVAFVATGANFPDALAASPAAAENGWPIYLAAPNGDPNLLAAQMKADGVTDVIILGGLNAVSQAYQDAFTAAGMAGVGRIAGANRYDTAAMVAEWSAETAGLNFNTVVVATGENFPDALCGGILCAKKDAVMLLVPSSGALPPSVAEALSDSPDYITDVYFLGGESAVSEPMRDAVGAAIN